jgi:hypothetical protein
LSGLLMFVYFLETGLLLLVVPWSVFWERNLFVDQVPVFGGVLLNHFVRGAISGIGVICIVASVGELRGLWRRRSGITADAATHPAAADPDLSH